VPRLKEVRVEGNPKGIFQGPNPPKNTCYDLFNIDLSSGSYRNRPRWTDFCSLPIGGTNGDVLGGFEYVFDPSYLTSKQTTFIGIFNLDMWIWRGVWLIEYPNRNTNDGVNTVLLSSYLISGGTVPAEYNDLISRKIQAVRCMWKHTVNGETLYGPAYVLVNGKMAPRLYSQFPSPYNPVGDVCLLDAIPSGLSNNTCLSTPPIGEWAALYKERLFMSVGKTLYFTGPDSAAQMFCNIWPANYNIDVGDDNLPITGLLSYGDYLIIFKENSVWLVSGEGVNGAWDIRQLSSSCGCTNGFSCVNTGDSVFFVNKSGVYQWAGSGEPKNISIGYIADSWKNITIDSGTTMGYDPERKNILIACKDQQLKPTTALVLNSYLCFNLQFGWSRWSTDHTWTTMPNNVVFFNTERPSYRLMMGAFDGFKCLREGYCGYWHIITPRYLLGNRASKTLRQIQLLAKKTCSEPIYILPMQDGQSYYEALINKSGGLYNVLVDAANSTTHKLDRTRNLLDADHATTDLCSLINLTTYSGNRKYINTRIITAANQVGLDPDQVKLSSTFDTSVSAGRNAGEILIMPSRLLPHISVLMYNQVLDTWEGSYGTFVTNRNIEHEYINTGYNLVGKDFRLYISNIKHSNSSAVELADILGWNLWILERPSQRFSRDVNWTPPS
jgi:hypothetical protein